MRILVASFMLLMTVHHSIAQSRINIIPKPSMVQELEGQFALNNNKIYVSVQFREVAVLLSDLMRWKQNRIFLLTKGVVPSAGSKNLMPLVLLKKVLKRKKTPSC